MLMTPVMRVTVSTPCHAGGSWWLLTKENKEGETASATERIQSFFIVWNQFSFNGLKPTQKKDTSFVHFRLTLAFCVEACFSFLLILLACDHISIIIRLLRLSTLQWVIAVNLFNPRMIWIQRMMSVKVTMNWIVIGKGPGLSRRQPFPF